MEQIPAITYVAALNEEDSTLYVSPQIRTLGFTPEEWLADPSIHLRQIHPDDRLRVEEALVKCRAAGSPLCCEYRLRAHNGTVFWFRDQASVVRDESGQALVLQGILIDITKSKQMEQELKEHRYRLEEVVMKRTSMLTTANEQLRKDIIARQQMEEDLFMEKEMSRAILSAIGDAVIGIDGRGCIEYMNPVAEQLSGWDGAEALSHPVEEIFPRTREAAAHCMTEDQGTTLSGCLTRKNGSEFAITGTAAPIHDRNGKVVGAVIVFREAV